MKCKEVQRTLIERIADGKEKAIPDSCGSHIEVCDECREELHSFKNLKQLLQTKDKWTPEEGFYERLVESAIREKNRAALSDSVYTQLSSQSFNLSDFLNQPLHLPRFLVPAVVGVLILLPVYLLLYGSFNTIGSIDYTTGNVFVQNVSSAGSQKGDDITRGTAVQTAKEAESILKLEGGTELLIASMSRIVVDSARRVDVERGRTYFDIPRGKGEFRVGIPDGEILVLGTSFAVTVDKTDTIVTVQEGLVQVTSDNKIVKVKPGYEAFINKNNRPVIREARLLAQMDRWVASLRNKRNHEELSTYYPSLSIPPTPVKGRK